MTDYCKYNLNDVKRSDSSIRRRRGLVIIIVLWVLVVLAVLVMGLANNVRLDNAVRVSSGDQVAARWLARSGVYQAMATLANDERHLDSANERWYQDEELFKDVAFPDGTYCVIADRISAENKCTYGVMDEASKLNLNIATEAQLMRLPDIDEGSVQAILRWRDGGDQGDSSVVSDSQVDGEADEPTAKVVQPTGEEEASDVVSKEVVDFYDMLNNRRFQSVYQLTMIEGIGDELVYGEDMNLDGLLEENENDGEVRLPKDDEDGQLKRGLYAYVTANSFEWNLDKNGQPRININVADDGVLERELALDEGEIKWINEHRPFEYLKDVWQEEVVSDGETESENPEEVVAKPMSFDKYVKILDRITVDSGEVIPGKINLNTVGKQVLMCLDGVDDKMAEQIVNARISRGRDFERVADLLLVPGISRDLFLEVVDYFTVRSSVFTIRSVGRTTRTGIERYVEAEVVRMPETIVVVSWREGRQ